MNFVRKAVMLLNREIPTETLIKRGMRVGKNFNRQQGCFIDPTHCFMISSTKKTLGYTKIGQVHIGNHVFIGANATILPGVTIEDYAVIGAGSVVTHDIPARTVVAGVPATEICGVDSYIERFQAQMNDRNTFGDAYRMGYGLNETRKKEILAATDGKIAFIK